MLEYLPLLPASDLDFKLIHSLRSMAVLQRYSVYLSIQSGADATKIDKHYNWSNSQGVPSRRRRIYASLLILIIVKG